VGKIENATSFARQNIRSLALYISSNNIRHCCVSFNCQQISQKNKCECVSIADLASKLAQTLQSLENIYLVIDMDKLFPTNPSLAKASTFIPGATAHVSRDLMKKKKRE
jgi:hypothetical protein